MSTKADWTTAETAVRENADELRTLDTHTALYGWAKTHKLDTRTLWPKVKTEMRKQLGIDYNEIRDRVVAERAAQVVESAHEAPMIELWSAGDAEVSTYAVCNADGTEAWYGEFHSNDNIYDRGDDLSAELSAAEKAVFLAGKAREHQGLEVVRLLLHTCHPDIDADSVAASAARHQVAITVDVAEQNPAVPQCRVPGYQSWHEVRLDTLFVVDDSETAAS
ncbi:hypothetical protein [Williamsia sp. D3]|uniref:hypothetical protein n=1 Tax=Williamsia TaxID=85043 RepID=UPI0003D378B4|nr:hypothetical protein [Williamsia sp. D3]ETD30955.1 hypothetical protein W823_21885 [Williamsia sp. D3]